jgi:hypothetical protein
MTKEPRQAAGEVGCCVSAVSLELHPLRPLSSVSQNRAQHPHLPSSLLHLALFCLHHFPHIHTVEQLASASLRCVQFISLSAPTAPANVITSLAVPSPTAARSPLTTNPCACTQSRQAGEEKVFR